MNATIHAFDKDDHGKVYISAKKVNDKILIKFIDNGKGIKKENLSKIFNPFFTTNREFGGVGLGLNIIYNIIKTKFNGNIVCKSTEKEGTEFDIELSV